MDPKTICLSVALLVAGAVAAGYRLRWLIERRRGDRLQDALDAKHKDFGDSMAVYQERESHMRGELQRARAEAYARQVTGNP